MTPPRLSFCTCIFNRASQLKQTWENNLAYVQAYQDSEWNIFDCGSSDGIYEFLMEKMPNITHRVRYCRSNKVMVWHTSVAKNGAHFMSNGRILMNLDADNYLVKNTREMILSYIPKKFDVFHLCYDELYHRGTYGRVAISREAFYAVRGYDENMPPVGTQDVDLMERAKGFGYRKGYTRTEGGDAIQHGDEIRIAFLPDKRPAEEWYTAGRAAMAENLAQKKWVANNPDTIEHWERFIRDDCTIWTGKQPW
jgi:hypothetical protein